MSSSNGIYIIVISLAREIKKQIKYWVNFIETCVKSLNSCSIIVVGSKLDLIKKIVIDKGTI